MSASNHYSEIFLIFYQYTDKKYNSSENIELIKYVFASRDYIIPKKPNM